MRAAVVVVLLASACGNKRDHADHKAAIDRYANADMQRNWAVLWTGQRPFKSLTRDAMETGLAGWVVTAMTETVIPRMTELVDAASKVTVPPPLAASHAMLLVIAAEYREEAEQMRDAATANDATKFKAAHTRMLETSVRYASWEKTYNRVLSAAGVVFAEVPQLVEAPQPAAKPSTYCGDAPCPCEGGVPAKLTECTLTAPIEIRGNKCAPGKVRFRDDGSLRSCMIVGDDFFLAGEATFHTDGDVASATSNVMVSPYNGLVCGAGPARWFDDGKYEACTVRGEAEVAGAKIPKGATAFVVFYPGGRVRYLKHGAQATCLDTAGAPSTPCVAPAW